MSDNSYAYWQQELKAPGQSRDVDSKIAGFWRSAGARTKVDWPIAIWYADGTPNIKIGNKHEVGFNGEQEFMSGATWLGCSAVSKAEYDAAMATGRWADGKAARNMTEAEKHDIDLTPGDNAAPVEEQLADQIATLAEKIEATSEPTTQAAADALSGLLDKMRVLLREAETRRVEEKYPHRLAAEAVDAKWRMVTGLGAVAGINGETRRKAFLRKEQARIDEEASEERDRQEEERRKAAEEAHQAGDAEKAAEIAAAPLPAAEAPRARAGSATGRATGLRKVKVGVITERAAFIAALEGQADFDAFLTDKAQKLARAGVELAGMKINEELQ